MWLFNPPNCAFEKLLLHYAPTAAPALYKSPLHPHSPSRFLPILSGLWLRSIVVSVLFSLITEFCFARKTNRLSNLFLESRRGSFLGLAQGPWHPVSLVLHYLWVMLIFEEKEENMWGRCGRYKLETSGRDWPILGCSNGTGIDKLTVFRLRPSFPSGIVMYMYKTFLKLLLVLAIVL